MLLVDVGTNAEIVLGNRQRLLACSSPTGPAFEGAQISSGQRAAPGAIERVRIDRETLEPRYKVIGCDLWSDEPGFAEATGDRRHRHLRLGHHRGDGRAVPRRHHHRRRRRRRRAGRALAPHRRRRAAPSPTSCTRRARASLVTQNDVRAIQLAKAALYAGVRLLMDHYGATVDRIVLAGAFGSHIDVEIRDGARPDPRLRARPRPSAGNAAGTGARIALLNRTPAARSRGWCSRIDKVETAIEPRFQEHFVAAMAIPHKTDAFPKLAKLLRSPSVQVQARLRDDVGEADVAEPRAVIPAKAGIHTPASKSRLSIRRVGATDPGFRLAFAGMTHAEVGSELDRRYALS